jgi:hypothetical protein
MSKRPAGCFAATFVALTFFNAKVPRARYKISTLASSTADRVIFDGNGVAADTHGNVFATGTAPGSDGVGAFGMIFKINSSGITSVAGSNESTASFPGCGDSASSILLDNPGGLAINALRSIFIAQVGGAPVLEVSAGKIDCLAGGQDFSAFGVAADKRGNVYIAAGQASIVYKTNSSDAPVPVAGDGTIGCTGAQIGTPHGLATDTRNNLYIADEYCNVIWKLAPRGVPKPVAGIPGNSKGGFSGDGGPATKAKLAGPNGVVVDQAGNIYIADSVNVRIRRVHDGIISTIAGTGSSGFSGDGGPATKAELDVPYSVAVGMNGKIYVGEAGAIADGGDRIRELRP